jgi:MFS family permease
MVPAVSTLARTFSSRRSMLTGIALAANGIGQLLSPLLAYFLIYNYNWRLSYIVFGILMFIFIAIPGQFMKSPQSNKRTGLKDENLPGPGPVVQAAMNYTFGQAIRTWLFWRMLILFVCFAFDFLLIMVHLAPYAAGIGISAATAANILSCFGGAMIVGRLGLGSLGDKIGLKKIAVIGFVSLLLSFILLLFTREAWTLFVFAILCGVGCGGINTTQSPITAEYFGIKSHGTIFGTMAGLTVMIGAIGPFVGGYLFDTTGNYSAAFIVCGFLSVLGLLLCLLLKPSKKTWQELHPSN